MSRGVRKVAVLGSTGSVGVSTLDLLDHAVRGGQAQVEVAALAAWQGTGFVDAARYFVPAEEKLYTWWSYRNKDWRASNRGRRLDHVWVSAELQPALVRHRVLTEARDWTQTSDHVPVMVELAL